jgi:putative sigma-54 modulation protein
MEKMEEANSVETKPVRTKTIVATKLDLTTAIMNMELLNHDFYVYTDDETDEVAVVYRRVDGGYGLLEIEKE